MGFLFLRPKIQNNNSEGNNLGLYYRRLFLYRGSQLNSPYSFKSNNAIFYLILRDFPYDSCSVWAGRIMAFLEQLGFQPAPTRGQRALCLSGRQLILFAPMLCVYVFIEWYGPTCQHVLTLATLYLSFVVWYRRMYIKLLLLTNRYQAMSWQSMFLRGHSYLESDSIGLFGRNIMAGCISFRSHFCGAMISTGKAGFVENCGLTVGQHVRNESSIQPVVHHELLENKKVDITLKQTVSVVFEISGRRHCCDYMSHGKVKRWFHPVGSCIIFL